MYSGFILCFGNFFFSVFTWFDYVFYIPVVCLLWFFFAFNFYYIFIIYLCLNSTKLYLIINDNTNIIVGKYKFNFYYIFLRIGQAQEKIQKITMVYL